MIVDVILDLALLAVPNYAVDDHSAFTLFERINHISQLAASGLSVDVVLPDDADEALWSKGVGPDLDSIGEFIELMGLTHVFSSRDLLRLYNTILSRAESAAEKYSRRIVNVRNFAINPSMPSNITPIQLLDETRRSFSEALVQNALGDFVVLGSAFEAAQTQVYGVEAIIRTVSGSNEEISQERGYHSNVTTFTSLGRLSSADVAVSLWEAAKKPEDLHLAVLLAANEARKLGQVGDVTAIRPFAIGEDFFESLRAHQCAHKGRFALATLSLCAQIVSGTINRHIGPIGRPNQERRSADKAAGWRVHLSKGAEALRLMFWETPTQIEFANVGVKQELLILSRHPQEVRQADLTRLLS